MLTTLDAPRHPLLDFLTSALPGSTMLGFELRLSTYSASGTDHGFLQIKIRRKKNVKKGIQFCLMVCGASGTGMKTLGYATFSAIDLLSTGRTTFVNTLCGQKVLQGKDADDATNAHLEEGVRIKPITVGAQHNSQS